MTQKPLMLTLNDAIAEDLDVLIATGKFGDTHPEAIGRIVERYLFDLEASGQLEQLRNRKEPQ